MSQVPEDVMEEWEKYDPMARKTLAEARKSLLSDDTLEDPQALIAIEKRIQDGATEKEIFELAADGVIRDRRNPHPPS